MIDTLMPAQLTISNRKPAQTYLHVVITLVDHDHMHRWKSMSNKASRTNIRLVACAAYEHRTHKHNNLKKAHG